MISSSEEIHRYHWFAKILIGLVVNNLFDQTLPIAVSKELSKPTKSSLSSSSSLSLLIGQKKPSKAKAIYWHFTCHSSFNFAY